MLKRHLAILFCFLLLSIGKSYAQQLLTLEACRSLALENNKAIKIASEQEQIAYYEKKDALTKFFPDISMTGLYLRNQKNLRLIDPASIPTSITTPPIPLPSGATFPEQTVDISGVRDRLLNATEVDIKNIWVGGVSLMQPIFTGGKIIAYNDLRSYAEELAKTQKNSKITDIIVDVDKAYWQVASLSNKRKLAQSYVELLQKMQADVTALEEEGLATRADILTVNVKLNEAEMTLTKADNGFILSKMLLCQVCGLDVGSDIKIVDEDKSPAEEVNIPTSSEEDKAYITEAISNRSEIKSLNLATKIYEKKEKIALAEFMPNLAFTANYLVTNPSSFNGPKTKFGGMWNVGLALNIPLNFASSSAKLNVAKAETRIKKYEIAEAKEKIELQVTQENYKLAEANKKLIATLKNTEKANENLRYANIGFEEGVISASDALAAHTAWLSANVEMIDAQIDLKLCKIYLRKALGRNLQNEK